MTTRTFPTVSFLTDFGLDDVFVGVCHGVLAATAPHARVIDITHAVPPRDVRTGALMLARVVGFFPVGVHLAVVDPGVGTARRGLAVVTGRGDVLVGPDNGLLVPAADKLGGREAAFELANPDHRLHPVSATFHGRDVFAPAAGAVARGIDPAELGPPVPDVTGLVVPAPRRAGPCLQAEVVLVDRFGNLQLGAVPADLDEGSGAAGASFAVVVGGRRHDARRVRTFGELPPDALGLYADSDGQLALARNGGSAAAELAAGIGTQVTLCPSGYQPPDAT